MGFIDIQSIPAIEVMPGARIRTPYGKHLMLSYLEMDQGAVVADGFTSDLGEHATRDSGASARPHVGEKQKEFVATVAAKQIMRA